MSGEFELLRKVTDSRDRVFAAAGWTVDPFGSCCAR